MVMKMNGRKIMKWENRPGEVGGVPQDEFNRIAAEVTARAEIAAGRGQGRTTPIKGGRG